MIDNIDAFFLRLIKSKITIFKIRKKRRQDEKKIIIVIATVNLLVAQQATVIVKFASISIELSKEDGKNLLKFFSVFVFLVKFIRQMKY